MVVQSQANLSSRSSGVHSELSRTWKMSSDFRRKLELQTCLASTKRKEDSIDDGGRVTQLAWQRRRESL